MSPIDAEGMLKTATRLAAGPPGAGRPAVHDLRRATSTAYYALFSQIIRHGALTAFPTLTDAELAVVQRWYTHMGVQRAAKSVILAAAPGLPKKEEMDRVTILRAGRPAPARQVVEVAQQVVDLYKQRLGADYNNAYVTSRPVAFAHVAQAETALKKTWSMWTAAASPSPTRRDLADSYRRFLAMALLDSGGTKRRD